MTAPFQLTPEQVAVTGEVLLLLAGCVVWVWYWFLPGGRAVRNGPIGLGAWEIPVIEFLLVVWSIFVLGVLLQYGLQFTVGSRLAKLADGPTVQMVVYGTVFHDAALIVWLVCRFIVRRRPAEATARPPGQSVVGNVGAGLVTFVTVLPPVFLAAAGWEQLLEWFKLPTQRQELVDLFLETQSRPLLIGMLTLTLVVAPVVEEIVFRAGLFRYLRTRTPRWLAYGVSAALFALLHGYWVTSVPLFVLGLVFAYAYEKTGRIAVPIVAHACFNLNTLLLVLSGASH
jgi:uncharacterized protein